MNPKQALAALDNTDIDEVIAALELLGRARYEPAVPKLAEMLDSPLVDLRLIVRVVRTLSEIGSTQAVEILKTYLYSGTTQVTPHHHDQTTYERVSRTGIIHEAVKKAFKAIDTQEVRAVLVEWQESKKD
jgi:HEAT repeat protein